MIHAVRLPGFLLTFLLALIAAPAIAASALRVGFSSNMPPYVIEASASGIEVHIVRADILQRYAGH